MLRIPYSKGLAKFVSWPISWGFIMIKLVNFVLRKLIKKILRLEGNKL
jgi:hypothetical protein